MTEDKFDQWMVKVDHHIQRLAGVCLFDLPDQPYNDWYEQGLSPAEAAEEALDNEGFFDPDDYDMDDVEIPM